MMKRIHLLYLISCILPLSLHAMNSPIVLTTIFAPAPLLQLHHTKIQEESFIASIKKAAIPLTCCFFYAIKKDNIWTDLTENSITSSICIYIAAYYCYQLVRKNQQNQIDEEIIETMQHLLHLLIIGHGIYNKITNSSFPEYKKSAIINSTTVTTLQFFLNNAYSAWFILFSYYQERYKDKPLYSYRMDQIDVFEIVQASMHEPDLLPLIQNFYDIDNKIYDYEPIFNCLEVKLKQINHKMKTILPA